MNSTPFHLNEKVILVTGASSGIGRSCAQMIAQMGGLVVANGRDVIKLEQTILSLSGNGHFHIAADLTISQHLSDLVDKLPQLDGVVHSAGFVKNVSTRFATDEDYKKHFAVNFDSVFALNRLLLQKKKLKQGGSVVGISSIVALNGLKTVGIYAATKAAMIANFRVLALELAPQSIRVNCVAPAIVKTPMVEEVEEIISEESLKKHGGQYPLGFGFPEDVASAVVYLLSPASRWVTGTTLVLDGGYSCQ